MANQAAFLALMGNMQSCAAVKLYAMQCKLFKIGRKNLANTAIRQVLFLPMFFTVWYKELLKGILIKAICDRICENLPSTHKRHKITTCSYFTKVESQL